MCLWFSDMQSSYPALCTQSYFLGRVICCTFDVQYIWCSVWHSYYGFDDQIKSLIIKYFLQSAILGMHSIVTRPMVVGGNVVPRPMMYIALTYDHRLIDGREAVFFLRRIKDIVEDPRRLLLDIWKFKLKTYWWSISSQQRAGIILWYQSSVKVFVFWSWFSAVMSSFAACLNSIDIKIVHGLILFWNENFCFFAFLLIEEILHCGHMHVIISRLL